MKKLLMLMAFLSFIIISTFSVSGISLAENSKIINLNFNNTSYLINLSDFEVSSKIHTIIWQASKHSRKADVIEQAKTIQSFLDCGAPIDEAFEFVYPNLKNEIKSIENKINSNKTDASYCLMGGTFKFNEEKPGFKLNKNLLYAKILNSLKSSSSSQIDIPVSIAKPTYRVEDLKKATFLRSCFQTDISKSSAERKNNIRLAINAFDKKMIYPGQTISFNETTGPRTKKNGYKEAKIIVNGKYVEGFGGGVCQASTTIYNACVLAGLDCRANCHTIPPSYVPKGLDAMVNSGTSDLKITNNLSLPIYIQAYCTNEKIFVNIYGENLNGLSYKTKSVILEEKPSKGYKTIIDEKKEYADKVTFEDEKFIKQYATNGYKTATYLQTFKNKKLVSEKLIRKDVYPPSEGIIIQGANKRPIIENDENFIVNFDRTLDFINRII